MKSTWFAACALVLAACAPSAPVVPPVPSAPRAAPLASLSPDDAAFLDTLQERTFRWFWETTDHQTGLTPDRWPSQTFSSVAAIGFGLTAYLVGAERGYVTRAEAAGRTLNTLRFLWQAPQGPGVSGVAGYRGFYYHFLDFDKGHRYRNVELSTIDTALLMAGVLAAGEYFDGQGSEAEIRALADSLYRRVDWRWMQRPDGLVSMGWRPENGQIPAAYKGYDEAMILYTLALGSPTHPADSTAWTAFTSSHPWGTYMGETYANFEPLFGYQYSHVWIDFRGIRDAFGREKGLDYFENSRRATRAHRQYAVENPMGWLGYGPDVWGLTACDGPKDTTMAWNGRPVQFRTYSARGASMRYVNDDGTIAPTAAGGSLPFLPRETLRALRTMRARYGSDLFGRYGFLDSFNPSYATLTTRAAAGRVIPGKMWVDDDYLGIDQGPILLMAENLRSGFVWNLLKTNPHVVRGLRRADFRGGWLDEAPPSAFFPVEPLDAAMPPPSFRIVVLGSSSAEGTGPADIADAWVNRYRAALQAIDPGVEVVNLARGGYTTYHMLPDGTPPVPDRPAPDVARNITRALSLSPDAIIVAFTSNDRTYGFANREQLDNFETVRRVAGEVGVPVWFTTTTPRNLDDAARADQKAVRDSLLARYPDFTIDFWEGMAQPDGTIRPEYDSGDHIHYNGRAHQLWFDRVMAARILETVRSWR